jgi:hypothetical protein
MANNHSGGAEVSGGQFVALDVGSEWKSYEVSAVPAPTATTFTRIDNRSGAPLAAVSGSALYRGGAGVDGTLRIVYDGNGIATALLIATDQIGVAADGNNAALELLDISNTNEPADTQVGDTAEFTFSLYGTEDGSTMVKETAAKIWVSKDDDFWNAADRTEHDARLNFGSMVNGAISTATAYISGDAFYAGLGYFGGNIKLSTSGITLGSAEIMQWSDATHPEGTPDFKISRYKDGSGNVYGQVNDATGSTSSGTGTGRWLLGAGSVADPALAFGDEANGLGFRATDANTIAMVDGGSTIFQFISASGIYLSTSSTILSTNASNDTLTLKNSSKTSSGNDIEMATGTNSATSGTYGRVAILSTYNQASGTAANTDFKIIRTETNLGSGPQFFIDLQTAADGSLFNIKNTGQTAINVDGNNAATELLELTNTNEGATGETGDTVQQTFSLYGSSDSGSSWAKHEAGSIRVLKASDWWGADEGDYDAYMSFFITRNGVETEYLRLEPTGWGTFYSNNIRASGNDWSIEATGAVNLESSGSINITNNTSHAGTKELRISKFKDGSGNVYGQVNDATGSTSSGTGTGRWLLGVGDFTDPSLVFGTESNPDGFYAVANSYVRLVIGGNARWIFDTNYIGGSSNGYPHIVYEEASSTNPGFTYLSDYDTGLGTAAADQLSGIAGGVEIWRAVEGDDDYLQATTHILTAGTGVSESVDAEVGTHFWKGLIDYSDIATQCGAVTDCDYLYVTLPAKAILHSALFAVEVQGVFGDTLTGTTGDNSSTYDNWIVGDNVAPTPFNMKAASGTRYGEVDAERDDAIPDADTLANYMQSYTATTPVVLQIHGNATSLNDASHTAGQYALIIHYSVLP